MSSDIDTVENVIRNFVRHGVATAGGLADGTTVVSLWDPTAAEGMNEADDFWNDSWIQIMGRDMKDQRRRVTDWVQATGVLTVDPAFINPNVSLLTVNSPLGDLVIDVADASVFRVGEAFIWDTVTPAGELVIITVVDTVLNQLTIAGPGIVQILGYLVANNAAISMSRRITDGTHFRLECYTKVEDTGVNTNPERWLQIYHWEQRQVTIAAIGVGGAQNLGGVVGVGLRRRIRSLKLRNDGTNNNFFTLFAGVTVVDSWGVPALVTRVIGDEDGWSFAAGEQPSVQISDITGGVSYVSARGVEASPT